MTINNTTSCIEQQTTKKKREAVFSSKPRRQSYLLYTLHDMAWHSIRPVLEGKAERFLSHESNDLASAFAFHGVISGGVFHNCLVSFLTTFAFHVVQAGWGLRLNLSLVV